MINNWPVFWTFLAWMIFETYYFGWNYRTGSDSEIICDGIGALIFAMSLIRTRRH